MQANDEKVLTRVPTAGAKDGATPHRGVTGGHQPKRPARRRFVIITALIILVVAVGAGVFYRRTRSNPAPAAARAANVPVPIVAGVVAIRDMPIYLDGLGTVQAFNTVTVRARVDGQLIKVAFTEGQDVKTGDLLVQLDPAPYQSSLDQAVAKKAQDTAQLANARVDLQRYADLLKTDSITQQIYDTQKALVSQMEATVNADQAAAESAKVNLDYATIRSPIDGRAGIRQVDIGNIVHATDAGGLVVVTQLRPISVIFTLPEQELSRLHDYQSAAENYAVLAVARDNTNVLGSGRLAVIDNQIDTTTGMIKLKATFANETLRLWPGQFVNIRLLLTTRKESPVVPASVVQRGPDGAFAFVIQEDQTVTMRPLKVAQIEAGLALIDEGLKPGEHVVVDGQYKLQPGSHVKTAESPVRAGPAGPAAGAKPPPTKKP